MKQLSRFALASCLHASALVPAVMTGVFVSSPAHAAPITCSGDIYQVQSGQLRIFDPTISAYVDVDTN